MCSIRSSIQWINESRNLSLNVKRETAERYLRSMFLFKSVWFGLVCLVGSLVVGVVSICSSYLTFLGRSLDHAPNVAFAVAGLWTTWTLRAVLSTALSIGLDHDHDWDGCSNFLNNLVDDHRGLYHPIYWGWSSSLEVVSVELGCFKQPCGLKPEPTGSHELGWGWTHTESRTLKWPSANLES